MSRFQKGSDGQLVKNDLIMNKHRRIVSKKKHATAKKEKRLIKAGYGTKKGKFGLVLLRENKSKSRSRKQKGGVGGGGTAQNTGIPGQSPCTIDPARPPPPPVWNPYVSYGPCYCTGTGPYSYG